MSTLPMADLSGWAGKVQQLGTSGYTFQLIYPHSYSVASSVLVASPGLLGNMGLANWSPLAKTHDLAEAMTTTGIPSRKCEVCVLAKIGILQSE